ncbi:MAG: hypothetical protein EOP88_19230 [Verrucomicrobiaceae bacterium]|nr:MAG: hypothetical protein EOP88_19230 [Verrucomicrobiaceae bacterium]
MNCLRVISLSLAMIIAAPAAEIFVLQSTEAMRRPNHNIEIRVEDDGKMTVKTQDLGAEWVSQQKTIDAAGIAALDKNLAALDWTHLSKEEANGRDGTFLKLEYRGKKSELWTPAYDSEKRGLVEVQKVIESLYQLAGLGKTGWQPPK